MKRHTPSSSSRKYTYLGLVSPPLAPPVASLFRPSTDGSCAHPIHRRNLSTRRIHAASRIGHDAQQLMWRIGA